MQRLGQEDVTLRKNLSKISSLTSRAPIEPKSRTSSANGAVSPCAKREARGCSCRDVMQRLGQEDVTLRKNLSKISSLTSRAPIEPKSRTTSANGALSLCAKREARGCSCRDVMERLGQEDVTLRKNLSKISSLTSRATIEPKSCTSSANGAVSPCAKREARGCSCRDVMQRLGQEDVTLSPDPNAP